MEYDRDYGTGRYDPDRYGQDSYGQEERRPPRKKKKRSKFARFMRALGKYLAQMPAQSFVVIGGSIAVVLVAVILLVMLLPGRDKKGADPLDEIVLPDNSPSPSLAPIITYEPTQSPDPTPNPDPLAGYVIETVGDYHDAIPAIQERLVALGYMDMPADGYTRKYGPATKNGIRRLQQRNFTDNQKWDGQIGAETYNLLMGPDVKPFYYKKGDTDESLYVDSVDGVKQTGWVTRLQNRLIELGYLAPGSATGTYGTATVDAVRNFQQYHGLAQIDGLAGQATLVVLYSSDAMDAVTGKANDRSKLTTPGTGTATSPDAGGATSPDAGAATSPDTGGTAP